MQDTFTGRINSSALTLGFTPLTEITGVSTPDGTHYTVECREHGELFEVEMPQTPEQAGRQRAQHLADHLRALAEEMTGVDE